jgi:hypothetical protein
MKTQYARLQRQFSSLSKTINRLLKNKQWDELSNTQQELLIHKLRWRFQRIKTTVPQRKLVRILGAAAIFIGLSTSSSAQITFKAPIVNPFSIDSVGDLASPVFGDLDNDGDLDMLAGDYLGNINYFENTGTAAAPNFAKPDTAALGLPELQFWNIPQLVDIDDDGDLDLFIGFYSNNDGLVAYCENTGTATNPTFAAPDTSAFGITPTTSYAFPVFVDLDGDGDFDLMVGEEYGDRVYFENTGTASAPAFAAGVANPFGLTTSVTGYTASLAFVDLDKDGDMDLIEGGYYGDFHYYENTGTASTPSFGASQKNPFSLTNTGLEDGSLPTFADLDGDGDMDLMVGGYYGAFHYYENDTPIGIGEKQEKNTPLVYPTVGEGNLTIQFADASYKRLEIRNALGQLINEMTLNQHQRIDIELKGNAGLYFLHFYDEQGTIRIQKIVKQ